MNHRNDDDSSPLERSHEPDLGFLPGDGGVRVGLQVPKVLLDESLLRLRQRPVIEPFVVVQFGDYAFGT